MSRRDGLVPRLEALFGGVWQAALDHAGIMSRRRARDIGAGEVPSGALGATVELLERLPPTEWPERWRGLGKASETCPTLAMCPERLVDGMIRPEDAVLVWDLRPESSGAAPRHENVAVGFFPRGCLAGLPRADAARTRWRLWYGQWDACHGGGGAAGWMASERETLEGMLAAWVAEGAIGGAELRVALDVLSARVAGFSPARVTEMANRQSGGAAACIVFAPASASRLNIERHR
ncbi:hypothetical protein ACFQS7_26885 [Dankookia sp. GCM10030260]|uniref:hypothetical protein n=1 Tax=Dankookia sp. GCM10030260 TaxID=3273390 RepID=UPI0036220EC2